jgi:hypothetical protein
MIDELRHRSGVLLRVLVTPHGLAASTRAMMERGLIPYALDAAIILAGDDRILRTVDCLLTAGDGRQDPDSLAAYVTNIAVTRNVKTFTLQRREDGTGITAQALSSTSGAATIFSAQTARAFIDGVLDASAQASTSRQPPVEPTYGSSEDVSDVNEMPLANRGQQTRTEFEKLTGE